MSGESVVDFIERWQTGAFLLLASAVSGFVAAVVLGSYTVPYGRAIGFIGGAALAFLAISYVLYGR